jgi:predicted nucleotidyltransferase
MTPESIDRFGLTSRNLRTIRKILEEFEYVQEAYVFGSRAMGTHRPGSDLDLVIKNDVDPNDLIGLHAAFEESDLPFRVDVIGYKTISNPDIKAHIDRVGLPLLSKD